MRLAALCFAVGLFACGSSTSGTHDGATPSDGQPAGCPSQQPSDGTTCTGSIVCQYGSSNCCGVSYSAMTCRCQTGGFSCAVTNECNFTCPDASSSG
jgi:hypothetical protein